MIENINTIQELNIQICALLELMRMADSSTSIEALNVASDICITLLHDLMEEVGKIEKMYKGEL